MADSLDIGLYNNDLYFLNGDMVSAVSDQQHVADTVSAFPSWWKENPADGVGVLAYMNSDGQEQALERSIKIQLQSDGYKANGIVDVTASGQLTINPMAEKL